MSAADQNTAATNSETRLIQMDKLSPDAPNGGGTVGRDRPILFSAPMVLALLREARQPGTGKTQTRRILRLPKWASTDPADVEFGASGAPEVICRDTGCLTALPISFATGDRLWVKETWRAIPEALSECEGPEDLRFAASVDEAEHAINKWRPSLFMPRWASRLTLLVTDVRVERLQDISHEDAAAEGLIAERTPFGGVLTNLSTGEAKPLTRIRWQGAPDLPLRGMERRAFQDLWERIHGPDAWAANPWVVAVSFAVVDRNIDDMPMPLATADALDIAGAA